MTMWAGRVSGGVLAPPILSTPRDSFQKFKARRVTASRPSITGSCAARSGHAATTIGASAVPRRHRTHFSL